MGFNDFLASETSGNYTHAEAASSSDPCSRRVLGGRRGAFLLPCGEIFNFVLWALSFSWRLLARCVSLY